MGSTWDRIQGRKDDGWMHHACWIEGEGSVADGSMVAVVGPFVDSIDNP